MPMTRGCAYTLRLSSQLAAGEVGIKGGRNGGRWAGRYQCPRLPSGLRRVVMRRSGDQAYSEKNSPITAASELPASAQAPSKACGSSRVICQAAGEAEATMRAESISSAS